MGLDRFDCFRRPLKIADFKCSAVYFAVRQQAPAQQLAGVGSREFGTLGEVIGRRKHQPIYVGLWIRLFERRLDVCLPDVLDQPLDGLLERFRAWQIDQRRFRGVFSRRWWL